MQNFHVTNIRYDLSDSAGELSHEDADFLPTIMDVLCKDEDEIADIISDTTGWLVESFDIE